MGKGEKPTQAAPSPSSPLVQPPLLCAALLALKTVIWSRRLAPDPAPELPGVQVMQA